LEQTAATTQQEWKNAFVDVLGTRMHYVHAGEGRPLLLIHGLTGSTINWRRNIDAFARDASVYAIDLVNMGKSDRMLGLDASLAATADRIVACMDALGLTEADIAGHSHGGAVVLMLAARHPERVRSLILFAPANPFGKFGDPLIHLYSSLPGRLLARIVPYVPRSLQLFALGRMYGDPARIVDGTLDGYIQGMRIPGTMQHIIAIVRGWFANMATLKAALPQIAHVPTLMVWGDRDRAVSLASARELQRELPTAELVVIPGGGHIVFEEMPEECNRVMSNWLARSHPASPQTIYPQAKEPRPAPVVIRTPLTSALQQASRRA
jgi:pimeloyl-ACP methyl ester carboxylesterase